MPLDTAAVTPGLEVSRGEDRHDLMDARPSGVSMPTLEMGPTVGAAFRAVREHLGLSIEDVATATRIRRQYLLDLEAVRLDAMPSRPFVIGYVRAYAQALGLDPDRAVARFKQDAPEQRQTLRAPVGVAQEGDRRLRPLMIGGVLVVLAFLAWNVAQHAVSKSRPARGAGGEVALSGAKVHPIMAKGPIAVGAPLPAPQESTLPAPYVTPGLAPASADGSPTSKAPTPAAPIVVPSKLAPGAAFAAHGAIYGAPAAAASTITLQANRSAMLIVRGGDGTVYFARQLVAGEAYRVPPTAGLSVETSDAAAMDVFVAGGFKGPLPAVQTPIAHLADAKPDAKTSRRPLGVAVQ